MPGARRVGWPEDEAVARWLLWLGHRLAGAEDRAVAQRDAPSKAHATSHQPIMDRDPNICSHDLTRSVLRWRSGLRPPPTRSAPLCHCGDPAEVAPETASGITHPKVPMTQLEGTYRGNVVSNIGPMQTGRLQVDVPGAGITGAWAGACVPPIPRSLVRLPAAGSTVWIAFEGGDSDYPIWTGVTWEALDDTADVTIESAGTVTITAAAVTVNAPTVAVSGVLNSATLVTGGAVASSYTNGAGNIW